MVGLIPNSCRFALRPRLLRTESYAAFPLPHSAPNQTHTATSEKDRKQPFQDAIEPRCIAGTAKPQISVTTANKYGELEQISAASSNGCWTEPLRRLATPAKFQPIADVS